MNGKGTPNCSIIYAKGATVNSGYCSGRNDLKRQLQRSNKENTKKPEKASSKGTDRSDNVQSNNHKNLKLAGKPWNSGARSGNNDKKEDGTVDKGNTGCSQETLVSKTPDGLVVSGTRGSFNAGSGVSRTRGSFNPGIRGSERSFNNREKGVEVVIKAAYNNEDMAVKGENVIGTRDSYNVNDQHSEREWRDAKIYSGTCAGIDGSIIIGNSSEWCSGTDWSFNALSNGKVIVSRGKLNTGAFSCCPT